MVRLRQEIKPVDLLLCKKSSPHIPRDPLVTDGSRCTESVENLKGTLGIAQTARANGYRIVIIK
jgi:hypothetical protein